MGFHGLHEGLHKTGKDQNCNRQGGRITSVKRDLDWAYLRSSRHDGFLKLTPPRVQQPRHPSKSRKKGLQVVVPPTHFSVDLVAKKKNVAMHKSERGILHSLPTANRQHHVVSAAATRHVARVGNQSQ